VSQDDEDLLEMRKALTKQIFQMAYYGKISPEYASSLEVSEKEFMYKLLADQLKDENKRNEEAQSRAKSQSSAIKRPHVSKR
jgi:hypothetical protein